MVETRSYITSSGRDPVRDFIEDMPADAQYELLTILRRLERGETLHMPLVRSVYSIAHGLWEIRIRDRHGLFRVFYYTKVAGVLYLLHAVKKKSRTIPLKDKELIVRRIREIEAER